MTHPPSTDEIAPDRALRTEGETTPREFLPGGHATATVRIAQRALVVAASMIGLACGNDASSGAGNPGDQGGQGASAR
jgi:hypothetical protein